MNVGAVIGLVITIVVAIAMIPVIATQTGTLTTGGDAGVSNTVITLARLLPVVLIAGVLIIAARLYVTRNN